ncbi:MAG TPA: 8-amino-7-oxononanoate synthase [Puia sp.]|nr:8-amino-7-oxononanoate synthase [Puia sp.]
MKEDFLDRKLQERSVADALRVLRIADGRSDYYSNDYLGISKNGLIEAHLPHTPLAHGSTGSRLLAGNYPLIEETEREIAAFHDAETALIFNSGYDANFGLLSCVAGKGDLILYDKFSHASLRDGIRQSFADSYSFAHNDPGDLEKKLKNIKGNCFVVTESVFSMDGDLAPLAEMAALCRQYNAHLIVDEAHATGFVGERGEGLVQDLDLQDDCFARIHTFGKALGCHGAAILGSQTLRNYLINFCRPFIYSTAIPPVSVAAIKASYTIFPKLNKERNEIRRLISLFDRDGFKKSVTPIQCFLAPGNDHVKKMSKRLLDNNLDARPILHPTVPLGEERLRITLHSYNTVEETEKLISILVVSR